jgi:ribonuclease HII
LCSEVVLHTTESAETALLYKALLYKDTIQQLHSQICTAAAALDSAFFLQYICTSLPQNRWILRVIGARELSEKMLRRTPFSLNAISHDSASDIVASALAAGVPLSHVYVDTVGDPGMYQQKLEREFAARAPDLKFTVAKKADSLYKTVSAASICAKVSTFFHHSFDIAQGATTAVRASCK